jgi:ABC-type multidrug transport system fused ATPase/permease subunit
MTAISVCASNAAPVGPPGAGALLAAVSAPGADAPPTDAEHAQASSFGELYRHLWHYGRAARGRMLAASAMLASSQLIKLAVPFLTAQAINTLQLGGAGRAGDAALWIGAIVVASIGTWTLHGPGRVIERGFGVEVRTRLSDALIERALHLPLRWHQTHHSGEVQHRVSQSSQALYEFAQTQFIYLQNAVNLAGPVLALTLLMPALGAAALVGFCAIGAVIVRFDTALLTLAVRENVAERRYATSVIDFVGNVSTLASLRLQQAARRLAANRLGAVFLPLKRSIVLNEFKWCSVDLLSLLLGWGLVAGYAWHAHVTGGALLIGTLVMIHQYAQQAGGVIGGLAAHYQSAARMRTGFAMAAPLWQAQPRLATPVSTLPWHTLSAVRLSHTHLLAHGQRTGIHDLSLTLRRGERIALVGASGCGKSTLLRVLAGVYEADDGHVEVDGVRQVGRRHLAQFATLIPQEAEIFDMSVRENLTLGAEADPAALDDALHISGFNEVLAALPLGLETPIAERGANLSGGQRQRLALARGLLAARAGGVLLLDEPTSALDPTTEARVYRRIDAAFPHTTVVSSVHRLGMLQHFDRIVLMEHGRVVDSGPMADLLDRHPAFAAQVRASSAPRPDAPADPDRGERAA